jgi:hypothetical protein
MRDEECCCWKWKVKGKQRHCTRRRRLLSNATRHVYRLSNTIAIKSSQKKTFPSQTPKHTNHPARDLHSRESALLLDPSLHIHQARVHLLQALDISLVAISAEPANHDTQLGNHVLEHAAEEPESTVETRAGLLLEDLTDLGRVELVAGQAEGFVVVFLRAAEGQLGEGANVGRGDPLQGFVAEGVAQGGHEDLGGEAGGEVVHEGDCGKKIC